MSEQRHNEGAPHVSVVIPTRDRCEPLRTCLEALREQTWRDFEVVVADDGSADDSETMVASFAAAAPIRWIDAPAPAGANVARNRGVERSRGALVAFLDSDCVPEPSWLERLVAPFDDERVAAVTGMVVDREPANVYELAFKGSYRVHGSGPAPRLVAGNMCVRRDLLLQHRLDEDRGGGPAPAADLQVSGRCDEEGLYLTLRAAGHAQLVAPDAVVLHDHAHTRRSFFRQAYRGGASAARLVRMYRLPHRLDMIPLITAWGLLPIAGALAFTLGPWTFAAPALAFALTLAAIVYNELARKAKTVGETLLSLPVVLAYYHVRMAGYAITTIRLWLGLERIRRVEQG